MLKSIKCVNTKADQKVETVLTIATILIFNECSYDFTQITALNRKPMLSDNLLKRTVSKDTILIKEQPNVEFHTESCSKLKTAVVFSSTVISP